MRRVPFDDALVRGISRIYDETPTRQGRRFWHYGKDLDAAKARLTETFSLVDKMANKGIIHRNTAGRYKSRLVKRLSSRSSAA